MMAGEMGELCIMHERDVKYIYSFCQSGLRGETAWKN